MEKVTRPSWEDYFMGITELVAQRSTCTRRRVGAILVRDKRIITTGYNLREQMGIPSGERHELCRGLHAEQNAIIQAAIHGVNIKGATLYCTNMPCSICTKMLINAQIVDIYYKEGYSDSLAADLLAEAGIVPA
jgi:dCMP deaminase